MATHSTWSLTVISLVWFTTTTTLPLLCLLFFNRELYAGCWFRFLPTMVVIVLIVRSPIDNTYSARKKKKLKIWNHSINGKTRDRHTLQIMKLSIGCFIGSFYNFKDFILVWNCLINFGNYHYRQWNGE